MRTSALGGGIAAGALIAPLLLAPQALPQSAAKPALPSANVGYPVTGVHKVAAHPVNGRDETGTRYVPSAMRWPSAHAATASLSAAGAGAAKAPSQAAGGAPASVGAKGYAAGTPMWGQAVAPAHGTYQGPVALSFSVADHAAAAAAGVDGVLFTAAPSGAGRGRVRVGIDYGTFAQAYGGDYGSRLRLVQLPACALTTPQLAVCRTQTPLPSTNDLSGKSLSAPVTLGAVEAAAPQSLSSGVRPARTMSGGAMVLAATSSPSGGDGGGAAGTYGATSLKASGSWSAGGSTGAFDYSYPVSVPPAASTLVPTVSLSYNSGNVDGQTAATQAQANWLGDGWSTPENYIEQAFVSCSDSPEGDPAPQATGDMCYDGPVLTLSLNGSSTALVWDSGKQTWKAATDDGEVVTHHTGSNNGTGTYNTDYWTVTDRTGTTYSFGRNQLPGWSSGKATTNSVQSEPVYSAHDPSTPGKNYTDPCYNATWSSSWCTMAYRWNLDYVKDLRGDAMAYYYKQDSNAYAKNANTTSATAYVRDAHLDHIDYGFTDDNAYGTIPDKVLFSTGDRCVSGTCDPLNTTNAANWPDVPYDLNCAAGAACQVTGPSFWSTVRLAGISTEQWNGSAYATVDSYAFTQTMPAPGDGTAATLWLKTITHTGSDTSAGGAAVTLPALSFGGIQEANRVDTTTDGLPPLIRYRIGSITTETGSVITVNYGLVNPCTAPVTQAPATNTSSCYPVYWTEQGASTPLLDWFNKYTVSSVAQSDPSGGSAGMYTAYKYLKGAAWHYDDNEVVQAKYRTYGQYRGYGDVQTLTGSGSDPVTESESTYYRGMSDDNNSTAVTLTDSQGGNHEDTNQLAGDTLETTQYNYEGGAVTSSTIDSYWVSAPTASRTRTGLPALTANATGQIEAWTRTALTDTSTTTWRTTETDTSYDATVEDDYFGLPTIVYQHGDLSVPGNNQQRCTITSYAPANKSLNLVGLVADVETDADPCGGTNPGGSSAPTAAQTNALTAPTSLNRPTDVVSDTRTFYDLQPVGSSTEPSTSPAWPQPAPTLGQVSEIQKATGYSGGAFTYQVAGATTYDSYGRALDAWDALGHESQSAYTTANGETTGSTATNALGQATTTTLDPYRGLPVTVTDPNGVTSVLHYDGLGRKTAVWADNNPTTATPNAAYTYTLGTATTPTVISTATLNNEGGTYTSTALYDALLRPRETQAPTPQNGRLINETYYDTHGWTIKTNANWWDPGTTPGSDLVTIPDNQVHQQSVTSYDGLGRAVKVQSLDNASTPTVDNITYTQYTGDKTITVPPAGGVATATVTDALGRTTELDQYTTAPTVTASTSNAITTVTISGGTTQATDYLFDNTGQQTDVKDAISGADWHTGYNLLGQVVSKNDPDAGASSLSYDPDGNLAKTTDAAGNAVSYSYDALNRKTGEYDAPAGSQLPGPLAASWIYDNSNNAVSGMTDPIGHLTTETAYSNGAAYETIQQSGFNVFGEPLGENITIPSSEGALAGTYSYTSTYGIITGLPLSTTLPAAGNLPSEKVATGHCTFLDLPCTMGAGLTGLVHGVTYSATGQVAEEALTTTAGVFNTYDPHTTALTDQHVTNTSVSGTPVDDTAYAYDPAGNLTRQTETRQGTQAETQCYQYDPLDRLSQAWTATDQCAATPTAGNHSTVGDGITGGAYWTGYSLDSLGQRQQETDHALTAGTADTVTTYTYGGSASTCSTTSTGLHTLASTSTSGPASNTGSTYCYDKLGNTTQRNTTANGQQSLTWNDLGQLTAVTTASAGSSYLYDPEGTLLEQKDPGTTTLYLPGQQLALNISTKTVTATRFYQLPGGGQAVRTGTGAAFTYELTDQHNTSTLDLSNTVANPVWRQQTPYGAPRGAAPASWPDIHGFLNKPQDTATGLTDVGARWYDPALGRFTSLDPVFETTSPQQQNGYTYAAANPVTGSDPTGLRACLDTCDLPPSERGGGGCPWGPAKGGGCAPPPGGNGGSGKGSGSGNGDVKISPHVIVHGNDPQAAYLKAAWQYAVSKWGAVHDTFDEAQRWRQLCLNVQQVCTGDLLELFGANAGVDWALGDSGAINPFEKLGTLLIAGLTGPGQGYAHISALGDAQSQDGISDQDVEDLVAADVQSGWLCNSFVGNTPVAMANGTSKPIDRVKVGDKIANSLPGADPGTKDQAHTVTAIHITHTDRDYTDVTIDTGHGPATITGTAHHPYWDETTHAWTDADQLHPGDRLQTTNAGTVIILALHSYTTTAVTYNLTVDSVHTYYVEAGSTPVLVHNCGDISELHVHVDSMNAARDIARQLAGLGDDAVPFMQKLGPAGGQVYSGMQSPDGARGWRLDFDPNSLKGVHVNWWDKSSGPKRGSGWRTGAVVMDGFEEGDYLGILSGFPKV
ncbi:hypothetical protein KGA66_25925 [Actinocrinis puniceicyclus]|uniref:Teneurin-like YD-shell domain-containing protein n=1 Tax=Actinocrinis puniceicyclus TaxID=977794 RepID=A0A8J8BFC1_9ACTN|nr:RHS repeat-associated core domain-containing protein [Actinocrinis puniceicyclus]MBS2966505.1 hypothetical protein [Actinocrinis puniceicyclus]